MKFKLFIVTLALSFGGKAQLQNLRKAILKSDLIISFNHYKQDIIWVNDYTSNVYLEMNTINKKIMDLKKQSGCCS